MKDKYNFEEGLNTDKFEPTVALPLINSQIKFETFLGGIDTMEFVEKDSNELIHIVMEDSLFSFEASSLLSVDGQSVNQAFGIQPISLETINAQTNIPLSSLVEGLDDSLKTMMENADGTRNLFPTIENSSMDSIEVPASNDFSEVTLSKGSLSIAITNDWPVPVVDVQIELRNGTSGEVIDTFAYDSIPAGDSMSETADLTGRTLENTLMANVISVSSPGTGLFDSVFINLTDQLVLDIVMDSMQIVSGNAIFPSEEIYNDTMNIAFDLGNGEVINTITFKSGTFAYDFEHSVQENTTLRLEIPTLSKDGTSFDELISLVPNGGTANTTADIDLAGYTMDLTNGDTNALSISIVANIVSSNNLVPFDTSQSVSSSIEIKDLAIESFTGNLGARSISLAADTFDMDLSVDALSGLSFASPEVSLTFNNGFGMPFSFDLAGIGMITESGTITMEGMIAEDPVVINAPSTMGENESTTVSLNNENSNIADLLSASPESMFANISANLNPGGETENFVLDTSKIDLTMGIDIPLHVRITDLGMTDTMNTDSIGIDSVLLNVKSAEFIGVINNGLPVDLNVQIYLADSTHTVFDSLLTGGKLATAAEVDVEGNTVANTSSDISIVADSAKLNSLIEASYMLIDFGLTTPNDGQTAVKLFTTAEIGLQLGIKSTISLNND